VQRTAAETDTHKRTRPVFVPELQELEEEEQEASHVGDIASPAADRYEFAEGIYEEAREEKETETGAHPGSVAHDDPLAHAFFEQSDELADELDEHEVIHQLSRGSRRAMYASVGIFAVSIVAIGGYSIYQNWIMPAPVELGASTLDIPAVPIAPAPSALPQGFVQHRSAAALQAPVAETETQLLAATNPASVNAPAQQVVAAQAPAAAAASTGSVVAQARTLAPSVASALVVPAADPAAATPAPATAELKPVVQPANVQFANTVAPAPAAKPVEVALAVTKLAVPLSAAKAELAVKPDTDAPTDEEAPSATGGPTYDELVSVGRALTKKNRRGEASEAFRRALAQSPQGSAALSGLGFVYLNADEKQNAKEYAQRAVQADASNAEGWIVLGAALEMLGDRAGAKDAYRNCVERGQGPYLNECRRVAR